MAGAVCLIPDNLEQPQALEFIAHRAIALAGGLLKFLPVCDGYMAARVINQADLMQDARCQRHRGSRRTQHLAEKLVGERQAVGLYPIMTGK